MSDKHDKERQKLRENVDELKTEWRKLGDAVKELNRVIRRKIEKLLTPGLVRLNKFLDSPAPLTFRGRLLFALFLVMVALLIRHVFGSLVCNPIEDAAARAACWWNIG
jgi:hypothetical protein